MGDTKCTQTILVTGASGFIGRKVCEDLILSGYNVVEVGRKPATSASKFLRWDFSSQKCETLSELHNLDVQYLIHCAGIPHFASESESSNNNNFIVNGTGIQKFLDSLVLTGFKPKVILMSSVAVYGLLTGINVSSIESTKPVDGYGAAKLQAESCVLQYGLVNGVDVACLRLPLVIGANAPGSLSRMINAINNGRMILPKNVNSERSWIARTDVSRFIKYLIEKRFVVGKYNLTSGRNFIFNEFVEQVSIALSTKCPPLVPLSFLRMGAIFGDIIKLVGMFFPFDSVILKKMTQSLTFVNEAENLTSWTASVTLDEAISELVTGKKLP